MREIKFRAWDKTRSEYLSAGKVMIEILPHRRPKQGTIYLDILDYKYPNRFILEQLTGLKDKNGVQIYEGDILSKIVTTNYPPVKIVIEFNQGMFKQYRTESNTTSSTPIGYVSPECLEVIGNIHENPELLDD
ncbi:MAG: YopX family protein [Betaproteobacteria bacterium]|nr:YopX family protein [Betaproteobacteria bacterium]